MGAARMRRANRVRNRLFFPVFASHKKSAHSKKWRVAGYCLPSKRLDGTKLISGVDSDAGT